MSQSQSFVLLADRRRERIIESLCAFMRQLSPAVAFRVTIEREAKERTDPQNRYLFGVCYAALADATGHSREDWHTYFCGEFFGWRERQLPGGRVDHVPRRTTTRDEDGRVRKLDVAEFSDFIEAVRATAAQHGVFIPEADPTVLDAARWAA